MIQSGEPSLIIEDSGLLRLCGTFARPIGLCDLKHNSNRLAYDDSWLVKIEKALGADVERVKVGVIRDIIDPPESPTGLPRTLVDLIICTYAVREQMGLFKLMSEHPMNPGKLDDTAELVRRELPDAETWDAALGLGREVFKFQTSFAIRDVRNVEALAHQLRQRYVDLKESTGGLPSRLVDAGRALQLSEAQVKASKRYQSVRMLDDLVTQHTLEHTALIRATVDAFEDDFARGVVPSLMDVVKDVSEHTGLIKAQVFASGFKSPRPEAQALCEEAQQVLVAVENVTPFKRLSVLQDRLMELLLPTAPAKPAPAPPRAASLERVTVHTPDDLARLGASLSALLQEHASGFVVDVRPLDPTTDES